MDEKTSGIVSYLTIIGWIVVIATRKEKTEYTSFHLRQMLGLAITGLVLSIIGVIPFIGWLISIAGTIFIVVLWIIGLLGALNGEKKLVPILGEKYQEWFNSI